MQSGTIAFAGQHRARGRFGRRIHNPLTVDTEDITIALDSMQVATRPSENVSSGILTEEDLNRSEILFKPVQDVSLPYCDIYLVMADLL